MRSLACFVIVVAIGCSSSHDRPPDPAQAPASPTRDAAPPPALAAKRQLYRAAVQLEGAEVPFFLELQGSGEVVITSGQEEFRGRVVSDQRASNGPLEIALAFGSGQRFVLHAGAGGRLEGTWSTHGPLAEGVEFGFTADPIPAKDWAALFRLEGAPLDLAGAWDFQFAELGRGTATLTPLGGGAFWSKLVTTGRDFRAVTAFATKDRVALVAFDGYQAWRLDAAWTVPNQAMKGEAYYWKVRRGAFSATRADRAAPPSFVDGAVSRPSGGSTKTIPVLRAHLGKPVLLEVGGTWCTSCNDALGLLHALGGRPVARDLAIVQAMVEFVDVAVGQERVKEFAARNAAPFEAVVLADTEDFDKRFPGLPSPAALPTFYFFDRNGALRSVYAGFMSSSVPAEYARQEQRFVDLLTEIAAP